MNKQRPGCLIAPNFMGIGRPYYDNILFGSSTFCVSHCKLVGKHSITDGSLPELHECIAYLRGEADEETTRRLDAQYNASLEKQHP